MKRTSLLVCLVAVLALALPAAPAAAQPPVDFGIAELGEIKTACFSICFGTGESGSGGVCNDTGTIDSVTIDPPFFVRALRLGGANSNACDTAGVTMPVDLPTTVGAGQALFFDVDLVAGSIGVIEDRIEFNGTPIRDVEATVIPAPTCTPGTDLLCLQDDRFTVRGLWRNRFGGRGKAPIVQGVQSDDSGLFYFFNANNWEMLLKVLDGCGVDGRYWVFLAATTNVEYTITVTDTQADQVRSYFNPLDNPAQPVQDTNAFATCP